MIDFRYHVVSIMAVFLALALGLFIGSTSLRGTAANNIQGQLKSVATENKKLSGQLSDARSQLNRDLAFGKAVEPYAVQDRLTGSTVTVISAPDVNGDLRDAVIRGLGEAGATVTGDVRLQQTLLDPEQDQFLVTLTDQLALPELTLPEGTGSERALALLADVLGTRPQDPPIGTAAAERVVSAYDDGKLISINGDDPRPASLMVLLAAPAPVPDESPTPSPQSADDVSLLTTFARDLDRASTGAVVSGPITAADEGGLLAAIRDDKSVRSDVSTVDSAELPSGVIATVIALVEQGDDGAGSYGLGPNADDRLPSPSPAPAAP